MITLILLLCSVPPLAVLAVAGIHGYRIGSWTVLTMLLLSGLMVSGSLVLALIGDEEPIPSIRFADPEGGSVATTDRAGDPVHLAWRRDLNDMQR